MASCGIIIYDTHFAAVSACNALSNGWSKKSRYERYTAGSVIRRDRLTRLAPSHLRTGQGGKVTANGGARACNRFGGNRTGALPIGLVVAGIVPNGRRFEWLPIV